MDLVCRLCLSVNRENMENMFENEVIFSKIESCLPLHVSISREPMLPKLVCASCVSVLDFINNFHRRVTNAQKTLYYKLSQGFDVLQDYLIELAQNEEKEIKFEFESTNEEKPELLIHEEDKGTIENIEKQYDEILFEEDKHDLETKALSNNALTSSGIRNENKVQKRDRATNESNCKLKNLQELSEVSFENNEYYNDNSQLDVKDEKQFFSKPVTPNHDNWNLKKKRTKVKCKNKKSVKLKASDNSIESYNVNNENEPKNNTGDVTNIESVDLYKCLTCFQVLNSRESLVKHYKLTHKPKKCKTENLDKNNFENITEDGNVKFKCGYCGNLKINEKGIKAHISMSHSTRRPFLCNVCGRTFKTLNQILTHHRVHSSIKLVCSHRCGYSTSYASNLRDHEKRHKGEFYKLKCETCGKGFSIKTWLEDHMNEHRGVKPYACSLCDLCFYSRRNLKAHEKSAHLSATDSATKRLFCVHCAYACANKSLLKAHLLKDHGIERLFLCFVCGKSFSSSSNLSHHKKFHKEEKTYICSVCSKAYLCNSHLKRHQRTHDPAKRHPDTRKPDTRQLPCDTCGRRFSRSSALKLHKCTDGESKSMATKF